MKKVILALGLLLGVVNCSQALPPGSYTQNCNSCTMDYFGTLTCECPDENQNLIWSHLTRASSCAYVINNSGQLYCDGPSPISSDQARVERPVPPGPYLQSCEGCSHINNILRCMCHNRKGTYVDTHLINPRNCDSIQNIDGHLSC